MDANEKRALEDIEKYGCHILHVLEDETHPRFSYSIGIEKRNSQPELIVTGLKNDLAASVINEYCTRVQSGEVFHPNEFYSGFIEGFDVTFKVVEKKHYREYFGWGIWLYKGEGFRVLQLLFPSTAGIWPWEDDAPSDYTWFLPKLYAT
jgi:hypothetical protein